MDGLTISNLNASINGSSSGGNTLGEIRQGKTSLPTAPALPGAAPEKSFADTLKDAVQSVNQMQQESNVKMEELATGKTQNIHDVMLTAEKADIALRLMVQVRNKIIEAYQEVMKMQV
jgi:flagellar hook-basal body complex protein FliE